MMNLVLNMLNLGDALGNYKPFIKSKQLEQKNIYLILFLKPVVYTILIHQKLLQHFTSGMMYANIISFHIKF